LLKLIIRVSVHMIPLVLLSLFWMTHIIISKERICAVWICRIIIRVIWIRMKVVELIELRIFIHGTMSMLLASTAFDSTCTHLIFSIIRVCSWSSILAALTFAKFWTFDTKLKAFAVFFETVAFFAVTSFTVSLLITF